MKKKVSLGSVLDLNIFSVDSRTAPYLTTVRYLPESQLIIEIPGPRFPHHTPSTEGVFFSLPGPLASSWAGNLVSVSINLALTLAYIVGGTKDSGVFGRLGSRIRPTWPAFLAGPGLRIQLAWWHLEARTKMMAQMVGRLATYKKTEQMSKYIEAHGSRLVTPGGGSNKYRRVKASPVAFSCCWRCPCGLRVFDRQ